MESSEKKRGRAIDPRMPPKPFDHRLAKNGQREEGHERGSGKKHMVSNVTSGEGTLNGSTYSLIQKELRPNKVVNMGNSIFSNSNRHKNGPINIVGNPSISSSKAHLAPDTKGSKHKLSQNTLGLNREESQKASISQ